MVTDSKDFLTRVGDYYAGRLAKHGASPQGVDWKDLASQRLRHRQFLRLLEDNSDASIIDFGCGYGDFLTFLRNFGHKGLYVGYDLVPAMIEAARERHGVGEDRVWRIGSIPIEPEDYAVASGVLNVKGNAADLDWSHYVQDTIDMLYKSSRQGFAFNLLSLTSDSSKRRPDLYYADPADTLRSCLNKFGRHVALLQDYGLYEFTLIVRHS